MKNLDQLRSELDAKIPRSAVSQREGGNGVKLDYLSNYYVKTRLNEVLGQGNWSYVVVRRELVFSGPVKRYNGDVHSVSYLVDVQLTAKIGGDYVMFIDTGYGDGSDKTNPGKAHELAAKEAATDALKRCAANLGQSMGLALYQKEQDNVEETSNEAVSNTPSKQRETTQHAPAAAKLATASAPADAVRNVSAIRATLKSAARVLDSQAKLSLADFKTKYKVTKVDELSDSDTLAVYTKIKTDYPELKLN